jgi:hypothetical protein
MLAWTAPGQAPIPAARRPALPPPPHLMPAPAARRTACRAVAATAPVAAPAARRPALSPQLHCCRSRPSHRTGADSDRAPPGAPTPTPRPLPIPAARRLSWQYNFDLDKVLAKLVEMVRKPDSR